MSHRLRYCLDTSALDILGFQISIFIKLILWVVTGAILGPKLNQKGLIVTFFEPKCKFSHILTKYHPNMIIWFYTLLTRYLWSILGTSWLYLGPKLTQKEFNLTKLCTKVQFFICCPSPIKTIYIAFFSSYETKMVTILVKLVLFRSKIDQKSVNYDMICVKMQFFYTHYLVIESHFHDLFYR